MLPARTNIKSRFLGCALFSPFADLRILPVVSRRRILACASRAARTARMDGGVRGELV